MARNLVKCGECGFEIRESPHRKPKNRKPCPSCGSKSRTFDVEIRAGIKLGGRLKFKHKNKGGAALVEGFSGDDLHRKSGRLMKKERLIDWQTDTYAELVMDLATGELVSGAHKAEQSQIAETVLQAFAGQHSDTLRPFLEEKTNP